jgi:hypothetical protein
MEQYHIISAYHAAPVDGRDQYDRLLTCMANLIDAVARYLPNETSSSGLRAFAAEADIFRDFSGPLEPIAVTHESAHRAQVLGTTASGALEHLERLQALRAQGAISENEFAEMKYSVLKD